MAAVQIQLELAQVGAFGAAVLRADRQAFVVVLQNRVDDAGHGIGAIDRRRAIEQHFESFETGDRHGIGVETLHRHRAGIGCALAGRVGYETASIEQHQRVADAERAQVDGVDVAARRVTGLRIVGGFEQHIAHLRNRAEQIVAADRAGGGDLIRVDRHHRQRRDDFTATDIRTGDDHFFERLLSGLGGGRRLSPDMAGGRELHQRAGQQHRTAHRFASHRFRPPVVDLKLWIAGLLGLRLGQHRFFDSAMQRGFEHSAIELALPARHHDGRDCIADEIGQRAAFAT